MAVAAGGEPDLKRRYDVVIIGSGAGGSTLALRLAEHGKEVLLIERGEALQPRARAPKDPVGRYLYHTVENNSAPLNFVGGQTKFYGSALYRLRVSDFEEVQHEAGVSPAWPIRYADLEPYYEQGEMIYRVHGAPDGDPSEPPRQAPFPYPPLPHAPIVERLVAKLEASGSDTAAIPRGLDYRPGGPCVLCSTCDAYYCQLDAKMDAEIAALRPALATGRVRLLTGTDCLKVLTDSDGKMARGVRLQRGGDAPFDLEADVVVAAAGLPASAQLLRKSRTDRHPEGLGGNGGALGRYLAGHSVGMIFPFMGLKPVGAIHTKTFAINSFYEGAPDWPYPTGVIQVAGQMPFWETASRVMRPFAQLVGAFTLQCFYMTEAAPSREAGVVFDGDAIVGKVEPPINTKTFARLRDLAQEAFRRAGHPSLARVRTPYLWHEVGTARFGDDPGTSVADPNCQVHGIDGLYVMDASVLPSAGAVNTGLTIIALALRAGDHIAGAVMPQDEARRRYRAPNA